MRRDVNPVLLGMEPSLIRQFMELAAAQSGAVSLSIGLPAFPTPQHVKEAAVRALDGDKTTYTPVAGIPELRRAAAEYVSQRYGLSYDPLHELTMTAGASQALDLTFRTLLATGDEVLLPSPAFTGYEPLIRINGGVPVEYGLGSHDFRLDPERVAAAITPRTKAVVLPCANPTGVLDTQAAIDGMAEVLRGRRIYAISDEVYSEITYEREHLSIAQQPDMKEWTVVVNGLSKSHCMTGWRVGFLLAPRRVITQLLKIHTHMTACVSTPAQYAALEALTAGADDAALMLPELRARRDIVVAQLTKLGLTFPRPEAAFYVFPRIPGGDSRAFSRRLLSEAGVAVTPGAAFGTHGEGHIRVSYAGDTASLEEAMARLDDFAW